MTNATRPAVASIRSVRDVAREKRTTAAAVIRAARAGRLTTIQVAGRWGIISDAQLAAWTPDRARQRGARKRWRQAQG
jgi:hypothetical protein